VKPLEPDSRKENEASAYEKFLLEEYQQIAAAHFKAVETISNFIKHYLVIAALPILLIGFLYSEKITSNTADAVIKPCIPIVCFLLSAVGTCVLVYIANLWFDQLFYARAINGLRSYFTRRSNLSMAELSSIRVLPISIAIPRYFGGLYFFWVILAIALINALYFALSIYLLQTWRSRFVGWPFLCIIDFLNAAPDLLFIGHLTKEKTAILTMIVWLLGSIGFYYWLSRYRETAYLKGRMIGIDIDGVLNRHREHFVELLQKHTGKIIKAEQITRIPVHTVSGLGVARQDELLVFNDPDYWTKMLVDPAAQTAIKRMARFYSSHQIRLYTHRPWPDVTLLSECDKKRFSDLWPKRCCCLQDEPIVTFTKDWLRKHGFSYNSLLVEDDTKPNRNRFAEADAGAISIFIEDDLMNAKRLAVSCEKVLLLDAPYNQAPVATLPANVVRIKSWDELFDELTATGREL
jgi:uncharacterized HAD superfamily protein